MQDMSMSSGIWVCFPDEITKTYKSSGFQGEFPDEITKTYRSSGFQGDFPDEITKTAMSSGFQCEFPDEIKGKSTTGRRRQREEVRSRMARIKSSAPGKTKDPDIV